MRTAGTFADVYLAARNHYVEQDDTRPLNPVVRHNNGRWILESGLNSADGADFECGLPAWDDFWYESYKDQEFIPSDSDEHEFVEAFGGFATPATD